MVSSKADGFLPILQYPPPLRPGARIGIVAPASPFDMKKFEGGLAVLKEMGFTPVTPEGLYKKERYLAGPDQHRADLVNRYFNDDAIQAVLCARGGYGTMRILNHLDFESIRKQPKIVVGFSDNSALLWALYQQCGLATFHGPTVTTLSHADPLTRTSFFTALTSNRNLELNTAEGVPIRAGQATGLVAGGNLTTLCHLVGTPFRPRFQDHIVFLEDRGEAPYRIDRMLSQMKLAGCFNKVAGLVLGSFKDCGSTEEIHTIIKDVLFDMPIPILGGFEVGHGDRNLTVPFGVTATLDTERGLLSYQSPATISTL